MVAALSQSWDSLKELLRFFSISVREAERWTRTCDSLLLPPLMPRATLLAPSLNGGHAVWEHPLPPGLGTGQPLYTVTGRILGEAQRTGAELEESRGGKRTGEKKRRRGRKDGLSTFKQAGLYPTASHRFNMPQGNKAFVGITALIASLLLGPCGTGAGERLCAPLALFGGMMSVFSFFL